MSDCFEADWAHQDFTPHPESQLIWCPDNGRQRVADFIDGAKNSLWIQNERYQDTVIIERLVRAATRGVKVHMLTKKPHSLKPANWSKASAGCASCRTSARRCTR